MATCNVTGTLIDSSAIAVSGAMIRFRVVNPMLDSGNNLVLPSEVSTTSAVDGTWTLPLDQGISGILTIDYNQDLLSPTRRNTYSLTIPSSASATFASLMIAET